MGKLNKPFLKLQDLKDTVDFSTRYITKERIFIFVYRLFFAWLKENDAFNKYRAVIEEKCAEKGDNRLLDRVIQDYLTENIIDFSFGWSTTQEGHEFWYILHKRWSFFIKDVLLPEIERGNGDLPKCIKCINKI